MFLTPAVDRHASLPLLEGSLTFIALAAAFCWPRLASGPFSKIERLFSRLARRQGLAVFATGLTALLLRLAILPLCPIPIPFVPDDFSFLLSSDTFAHGRLTNPTPAMWMHFETIHVSMNPTYMSMYFPSNGLVLALGKALFGQPWYGLLLVSALMCAALCWMLQAWLPPTWALLGGAIAIVHLSLFSYWINSYHSAGLIAALGGALVLGALPRLTKRKTLRHIDGILMAAGIALLLTTRPFDGLLLCLPVAFVLGRWALFGKNRPAPAVLLRQAALPLMLVLAAGSWLAYYDYRAFGSPTTLPYTVNRQTYAMAPYFVWQKARPEPVYRHAVLRKFYYEGELDALKQYKTPVRAIADTLKKFTVGTLFFSGFAFLPLVFALGLVLRDRRTRFLVLCVAILIAGLGIQYFLIPHYMAVFTAAFLAIALQAMRHLRQWKPEGKPVGMTLVRLMVAVCLVMAGVRTFAAPLHMEQPQWPASKWNCSWFGPAQFGNQRAQLAASLEKLSGKQLVIVRYSASHNPFDEWVYNSADIDGSKVIWARDMDPEHNSELLNYYKDRHIWLVEPDVDPTVVTSYSVPGAQLAATKQDRPTQIDPARRAQ